MVHERFPAAEIIAEDAGLAAWARRIVQFITAPGPIPDLPLDIQGTTFQAQVWRALQKIPLGKTADYTEIAAAVGRPEAVRAVAQACAVDSVALLVPCHRVIRRDGTLGGYRWGSRKSANCSPASAPRRKSRRKSRRKRMPRPEPAPARIAAVDWSAVAAASTSAAMP